MATIGRQFRTEKWGLRRACIDFALFVAVMAGTVILWLALALFLRAV